MQSELLSAPGGSIAELRTSGPDSRLVDGEQEIALLRDVARGGR